MSVGWLEVQRTEYETLRNKKLFHMRYLLFWDISSADPGMLILSQKIIRLSEDPMEPVQSWTKSGKMKQQTHPHPPPTPPPSPNHG